jgi:hypothetical protein
MRPQYNTEVLIEMIKRACAVPTSQLTYQDADWAAMATTMLQTMVVPLIMSTREDYFVEFEDVLSPADGYIPFPKNAVGSKLRNVAYVSQESPLIVINLPRIDIDVVAGVGFYNVWTLAGFYVQGNDIVLYPNTSIPTNTRIRLWYYRRCLDLAAPDAYGQVQSIDENTNTIVLDTVPLGWEVGTELNVVSSEPNFTINNALTTITAISAPSIMLDSIEGIEVGDYVSGVGYSAIPQIPIEAMNYLAQLVAVIALEGLGDSEGMAAAEKVAQAFKENLLVMISQRVDGSVKKVINPSGGLRVGSGSWRRTWGW